MSDYAIVAKGSARMPAILEAYEDTILKTGEIVIPARSRGSSIRCISGYVWVTVEGDADDYVLAPHEEFKIPRGGKVVVSGVGSFRLAS